MNGQVWNIRCAVQVCHRVGPNCGHLQIPDVTGANRYQENPTERFSAGTDIACL